MIKIHATKKLLVKLPVDEMGLLPEGNNQYAVEKSLAESPLSNWHANIITLQRRNCILLAHDATRFPLFIPRLTKPDFANLDWHFQDSFMNTLLKVGATQEQLDAAAAHLTQMSFDSICNRSVQGTINQMKADIEHMMWSENGDIMELSGYRTGVWLSNRPCKVKGQKDYVWPQNAMFSLLDSLSTTSPVRSEQAGNVVIMENYRKDR